MRRLGQHFLKNGSAATKIVEALDLHAGEAVIEVGPGHGELTMLLAERCKAIGCSLVAVEKDAALADALRSRLSREGEEGPSIINGDILTFFGSSKETLPKGPYNIVGNIPYYITGHLLRIIGELEVRPGRAVLMLQKEVAERLSSRPPRMNRLAASVQYWAEPSILLTLKRTDFSPPPKVDSAVVVLTAREKNANDDPLSYYRTVKTLFAQPRKTILNNMGAIVSPKEKKTAIAEALRGIGVLPEARPQDLSPEDIAKIAALPL